MRFWKTSNNAATRIVTNIPGMNAEKLLEIFAVDPETPWLTAVLSVLAGMEEIAKENVAVCTLKDSERAFYAGGISVAAEMQERIIELVKKGNEAKRGAA